MSSPSGCPPGTIRTVATTDGSRRRRGRAGASHRHAKMPCVKGRIVRPTVSDALSVAERTSRLGRAFDELPFRCYADEERQLVLVVDLVRRRAVVAYRVPEARLVLHGLRGLPIGKSKRPLRLGVSLSGDALVVFIQQLKGALAELEGLQPRATGRGRRAAVPRAREDGGLGPRHHAVQHLPKKVVAVVQLVENGHPGGPGEGVQDLPREEVARHGGRDPALEAESGREGGSARPPEPRGLPRSGGGADRPRRAEGRPDDGDETGRGGCGLDLPREGPVAEAGQVRPLRPAVPAGARCRVDRDESGPAVEPRGAAPAGGSPRRGVRRTRG